MPLACCSCTFLRFGRFALCQERSEQQALELLQSLPLRLRISSVWICSTVKDCQRSRSRRGLAATLANVMEKVYVSGNIFITIIARSVR